MIINDNFKYWIITDVDVELECDNKHQLVKLTTLNRIIREAGKVITIEYETPNEILEINFMYNNFQKINYMHNKELVEGVNISNFLLYLAARPIAETSGTM